MRALTHTPHAYDDAACCCLRRDYYVFCQHWLTTERTRVCHSAGRASSKLLLVILPYLYLIFLYIILVTNKSFFFIVVYYIFVNGDYNDNELWLVSLYMSNRPGDSFPRMSLFVSLSILLLSCLSRHLYYLFTSRPIYTFSYFEEVRRVRRGHARMGEREHYVPPDRLLLSDSGDGSSRSLSLPLYLVPHLTTTRQARPRRQKVDVIHW